MPTFIRTAPNIYEFENFKFYPGTNFVPQGTYDRWKTRCKESFEANFSLQLQGPEPAMTMIADKDEGKKAPALSLADVITKAPEKKAIELIKETLLLDQLEAALKVEHRKAVIAALQAQIKEMKRAPEPEELLGGPKASAGPQSGNMMDDLGIDHDFTGDGKGKHEGKGKDQGKGKSGKRK